MKGRDRDSFHEGTVTSRPVETTRASLTLSVLIAAALLWPLEASAEQREQREPLLGIYLQPMLSATLPGGSATYVTDVYGSAHPTGAVGLTFHFHQRFTLALDLEVQAWRGELPSVPATAEGSPEIEAFALSFLNYWTHLRGRIMLVRSGRIQLDADAVIGLAFGREDGERFRSEGLGVSVGLGPVLSVALGRYIAISFSATIDTGWIFYDVESPQSNAEDASYTLVWPRILIGIGLHGFLAHRRPTANSGTSSEDDAVPHEESEVIAEPLPAQTAPAETNSAPSEPQNPTEPASDDGLESPW